MAKTEDKIAEFGNIKYNIMQKAKTVPINGQYQNQRFWGKFLQGGEK